MDIKIKTAKLSSAADDVNWGGSYAEDGLFILLEVSGSERNTTLNNGKKLMDWMIEKLSELQKKNINRVTEILREIKDNKTVKTVILGILDGNTLFLGNLGRGYVYLKRGEKLGKILLPDEVSRGVLHNKDLVFFCTDEFKQVIEEKEKNRVLELTDPDEIMEYLTPILLGDDEHAGIAVLAFCLEQTDFSPSCFPNGTDRTEESRNPPGFTGLFEKAKNYFFRKIRYPLAQKEISKSKKTLLTVAVILAVLLIVSIFFNINHSRSVSLNKKTAEALNLASLQYEEAVSLIDLNPVRARELLSSSKLTLGSLLLEISPKSSDYAKTKEWLDKISSAEVAAYKIFKLTAVPLFFDLNFVKQGASGSKIASYQEKKAILDEQNQVVYFLNTTTKESVLVAGSDIVKDARTVSIHGDNIYILNSDGVVSIDIERKSGSTVIFRDDKWGEIISLVAFSGNLYLLDRTNNVVWKYIGTENGFSGRYTYFNPDVRVNLSNASDMVIDGSVWITDGQNDLLKFTRGLEEQFSFKGLADTITSIEGISTSDTDKYIYIYDRNTARILMFDKDGAYQSQYQWDGLKDSSDIEACESEKKIFILSGSKIYAVELK